MEFDSFIVKLKPEASRKALSLKIANETGGELRELVPSLSIFEVASNQKMSRFHKSRWLRHAQGTLQKTKLFEYVVPNYPVQMRQTVPSDPLFPRQWSLQNKQNGIGLQAQSAWSIGQGGVDRDGQDIVVAVVDGGVDTSHPDLQGNIWVNSNEIPNNGIDDDGNGYVDDVNGWNAYTNTGRLATSSHGTHVSGIIGARGDNNQAIAGVNWRVKVMPVDGSSADTAVVLRAYNYILTQKRRWNESQGKQGANVVVTNSSFGVDRANCSANSFQPWNEVYEAMGSAGILSAAATANSGWDIEVVGDVPTGCSSPFLVTVTNVNSNDQLYTNAQGQVSAGWGATSIDLGAPGTGILSLLPNGATGELSGTSMATPHVAGAVALLHSVASQALQNLIRQSPAQGAAEIKRLLLESVDPVPALAGKTLSNGRLNLERAVLRASRY